MPFPSKNRRVSKLFSYVFRRVIGLHMYLLIRAKRAAYDCLRSWLSHFPVDRLSMCSTFFGENFCSYPQQLSLKVLMMSNVFVRCCEDELYWKVYKNWFWVEQKIFMETQSSCHDLHGCRTFVVIWQRGSYCKTLFMPAQLIQTSGFYVSTSILMYMKTSASVGFILDCQFGRSHSANYSFFQTVDDKVCTLHQTSGVPWPEKNHAFFMKRWPVGGLLGFSIVPLISCCIIFQKLRRFALLPHEPRLNQSWDLS